MPRGLPVGHPDRETARAWAELYRKALAAPDGIYAEYDEDGYSLIYIDAKDPEILISMLECLARFGTLEDRSVLGQSVQKFGSTLGLRHEYKELLSKGHSKSAAVDLLATTYQDKGRGWSKENIERKLGLRK